MNKKGVRPLGGTPFVIKIFFGGSYEQTTNCSWKLENE